MHKILAYPGSLGGDPGAAVTAVRGLRAGTAARGGPGRAPDGSAPVRAGDIANRNPVALTAGAAASEALALMNRCNVRALIVVDDRYCPEGLVPIHDLRRGGRA